MASEINFHPMKSSQNCSVCSLSMSGKACLGHLTDTETNHIFHEHCLRHWYQGGKKTCPLCKQVVPLFDRDHLPAGPLSQAQLVHDVALQAMGGGASLPPQLQSRLAFDEAVRNAASVCQYGEVVKLMQANGPLLSFAARGDAVQRLVGINFVKMAEIGSANNNRPIHGGFEALLALLNSGPISDVARERAVCAVAAWPDNSGLPSIRALLAGNVFWSGGPEAAIIAAQNGNLQLISEVLRREFQWDYAIAKVVSSGSLSLLQTFLKLGRPISEDTRGDAVCIAAALPNNCGLPLIDALLANGDISKKEKGNAVEAAARQGNCGVMGTLLSKGPISNDAIFGVMLEAIHKNDWHIIRALREKVKIPEKLRASAIMYSADDIGGKCDPSIIPELLADGPIAPLFTGHIVNMIISNENPIPTKQASILALLKSGPICDQHGSIAVRALAAYPNNAGLQIIQAVLAQVSIPLTDRNAAVEIARKAGNQDIVKFLWLPGVYRIGNGI